MSDSQPWYLSRTIWASLIGFAALVLAALTHDKIQILQIDQDNLVNLVLTLAGAVAAVAALLGRIFATKQIGSPPPKGAGQ